MTEPMTEQFTNQTERRRIAGTPVPPGGDRGDRRRAGVVQHKVDSRHAEARDLVTELQENRADMDHAEKANMRQSVNLSTRVTEHSADQQRRLLRMVDSPYFGRIDVKRDDDDREQPIYIGVHSFYDAKAERQLVHDWRAPVSSMFYEYELGPASYEAPAGRVDCEIALKRQFRIENRELVFMLDTSLNIQDDLLQAELSRASDEKMKNIVATIQRDQNAIIRNEQAHSLIIQGAAGSGKTSIALHRIAFLLYRYKETIRSQDILIISPNKVFASYISQVLPELGEEMIQETTMEELAGRELQHNVKFETFAEQVGPLLEGKDEAYAERVRFKAGPDFLKQLDAYANHVRATNFQAADLTVGLYTLSADWIASRFDKHKRLAINDQIARVTDDVVRYMQHEHNKRIVNKDRTAVRNALTRMFTHTSLKPLYKEFYNWLGEPEMFKQLKGGKYEYNDVFPLIYLRKLVEPVTPSTASSTWSSTRCRTTPPCSTRSSPPSTPAARRSSATTTSPSARSAPPPPRPSSGCSARPRACSCTRATARRSRSPSWRRPFSTTPTSCRSSATATARRSTPAPPPTTSSPPSAAPSPTSATAGTTRWASSARPRPRPSGCTRIFQTPAGRSTCSTPAAPTSRRA